MMWLDWIADSSQHFWLASLLGLLAWWWTLTTFSVPLFILERLTGRLTHRVVIFGILVLSLLLAISLAFISHALLDGFSLWYQTPLGPPLDGNST